ncbi:hypothetical protein GGTG_14218 [Gaeumannomyces tritici R3-111a-1]|uniref:Uncharacterized protein n=1 Tax=Gaeumannomyces tritici (strain R3-111a-1) TaxID=644352 RepID=J3PKZ2_GAET3|nr:hypothetical protein GGTG_14218 [Gaeumannomyces tritici R3-111a-1]EJT68204.1 hypothetical protein GGTG_14218 [Gaeumannomyces tritici R3-111a-1]
MEKVSVASQSAFCCTVPCSFRLTKAKDEHRQSDEEPREDRQPQEPWAESRPQNPDGQRKASEDGTDCDDAGHEGSSRRQHRARPLSPAD